MNQLNSPLTQLQQWGHDILGTGPMYAWVSAVAVLLLMLSAFRLFKLLLDRFGRRAIAYTTTSLDDKIFEILSRSIMIFGIIVALYLFIRQLTSGIDIADRTFRSAINWINSALYIAGALVVLRIVLRSITIGVRHALRRRDTDGAMSLENTLAPLVSRVVNFAIALVALIIVLQHFGQNISTLVVSLGVGSLAVALAAQDTLSNMIAGFMILIDRPFRVGDRIMIPSGEVGDVYEIGVRSSKILDFNNNLLIVPNNELVKTRIVNYSYPASIVRCVITVGVAYGSDVTHVKEVLLAVAVANPEVLSEPAPDVRLMDLGESSLDMRLTVYVSNFQVQFDTTEKLRVACYDALRNANIEIPFPQRDIHIRSQQ